jgi:predicted DCC family thiol-disulfide oxidoreductase YuxK
VDNQNIILFFDGVCGLCNGLVDWLLPRDSRKSLKFATLQGVTAAKLLPEKFRIDLNTVVVWHKGKILTESDAIFACLRELGWPWKMVIILKIIPAFMRNSIYKLVAKYRYKIFGIQSTCRMPLPGERLQFLD